MPEWEFINKILDKANCNLLLDLNNIIVSGHNITNFSVEEYLQNINLAKVKEIHLAGHEENLRAGRKIKIDTHTGEISDELWHIYERAVVKLQNIKNPVATLIEWDSKVPNDFFELEELAIKAKKIIHDITAS